MTADEVEVYMNRLGKLYESIHKENPYVSILCGDLTDRYLTDCPISLTWLG